MITVDDREFPWQEGLTLDALLAAIKGGQGIAVVKLDGKLVSRPHFKATPVPDGSRVVLIPMIAGG